MSSSGRRISQNNRTCTELKALQICSLLTEQNPPEAKDRGSNPLERANQALIYFEPKYTETSALLPRDCSETKLYC
jgi:hypothetical protein